jgi:hypothetical protein
MHIGGDYMILSKGWEIVGFNWPKTKWWHDMNKIRGLDHDQWYDAN